MELEKQETPARTDYNGVGIFTVESGKYLQIRHGTLANPTIDLQEQVPTGKSWEVHITVSVKET